MAITKIHAIKATVQGAVNYICDKSKTDSGILISSFATSPETAAYDFKFTLSHTDMSDPNKAYHLIQSFAPGEVSAKEAHRIGIELADRLLQGRYSYVISTHTDKGHTHNHLIFCASDNINYNKYHDCRKSYWNIRRINDEICAEHNLSVPLQNRHGSKSYHEWQNDKNNTSWKSKLKSDINESVKRSNTYEDFISLMMQKGYEIKDYETGENSHKYIAFRALGQQRWIRGREKSLGADYTRERIRERIEEKARIRTERMASDRRYPGTMIDTTQERFAESPGLKRWADLQNLKTAAKLQSKLAEMGFDSLDAVDDKIASLHLQTKEGKKTTVALDKAIKSSNEILHYARQYSEKAKYDRNHARD